MHEEMLKELSSRSSMRNNHRLMFTQHIANHRFRHITHTVMEKLQNAPKDLAFYANGKYFKRGKPTVKSTVILESLKEWCRLRDVSTLMTQKQKAEALNKALQFPNVGVKLVCEIFHLEKEKEHVKEVIDGLLSSKKYKEGFYLISALNLEEEFPLKSCIFQLFFLGHETWVKAYLNKCPNLQTQFIETLDSLCKDNFALQEFVWSLNIEGVKPKNMVIDTRWLTKRLPAFIEYFNIDIKKCPNLYHSRCLAAMSYLFRRRFTEGIIEYEPWEELILDTIKDHVDIQKELLIKLICVNETTLAFRFAQLLKMNTNDWPELMKRIPIPSSKPLIKDSTLTSDYNEEYLTLRLDPNAIRIVDTPEKLIEAVDDISENYDVVALDAEWKPNLGVFKEKLSLCQLAVWDYVYLLDILALKVYESKQIWEYLLRKIFINENILKLGYGGEYDLKVLMKTIECEKDGDPNYRNLIDLGNIYKKLETHYPEVTEEIALWHPADNDNDQKGLSKLCRIILGRHLNKGEQFSNWEQRPLRKNQIIYASLDAFCLLMMYEKLYHVLQKFGLDFEKVLKTNRTPFKAERPKVAPSKEAQKKLTPIPIKDFKVVVDNVVGGITKYLRLVGADVINLEEGEDHMNAVKIAQSQRRIIITSGAAYKKIKGYMPENMVFCTDPSLNSKMQVLKILEHYKVQCQDSDLFSRCTMCNESMYVRVRNEELYPLWTKFVGSEMSTIHLGRKNSSVFKCDVTAMDGTVYKDMSLQLAAFSPQVFDHIRWFFVCSGCGKIYWEGSHLSRVKKSISKLMDVKSENRTVYSVLLGEQGNDEEETTTDTSKSSL
ncbi:exonuclease mut-7 homolog [Trichonephila clavata]|uniref:Exonuclease mut-7 homolog n=1 Tax=Trichonephila clavata TaxID=2740835 RepID=A0A8X6HJC0_TRICU|nr:exonuclease mut-7 homolog [Trichonephila clavata]